MNIRKLLFAAVFGAIYLAGFALEGNSIAYAKSVPRVMASDSGHLENAGCQKCHAGDQPEIPVAGATGEKRLLNAVKNPEYSKSVHGKMQCVDCHKEITDSTARHQKSPFPKPDCIQCHQALWEVAKKEQKTPEKARLGGVVQNIDAYKESFHALKNKEDPTHPNATCEDCHSSHSFNVPSKDSPLRASEWRFAVPALCGEKCHTDELEEYGSSAHGKEVLDKHNQKSAICIDCHTSHEIKNTSLVPFKRRIIKECGGCHEENLKSYSDTYHGQVSALGYVYTAKCYDCHGSHGILGVKDPESKIHPANRLRTCKQCHDGKKELREATPGFVTFGPHANNHDRERYPQMWFTSRFMLALLIGVFTYFWAHSLLWWYREYKDRKEGKSKQLVKTNDLVLEGGKQVRRFGLLWRIGHLCFALSVMMLILTGMAVFYADSAWAPVVMKALGGPKVAGLIHRVCATIMLSIFFIHLIGVATNIVRNRKTFQWFGPNSLIPRWQDFKDAWGMFKWFVDKGPRPVFDRWTYWEKFDYWAVFWGMGIIGSSGMMLAFPNVTATFLPGWVFNVATLVHGEEAFLAAVFLFTVHFFNNHFRPDKFPPPDVVMFTGTVSLEEFKREHTVQYNRLVETGELEKYLVDAPSRPMTLGSKLLGLTLIAMGLTLLTLVTVGFVGSLG